jgi:POT family proton-dependent oligopeptide transporter
LIEQMGSSINLFNERAVNRMVRIPGIFELPVSKAPVIGQGIGHGVSSSVVEIQSAQLLGVTGFLLLILSPVFVWLWGYLERRNLNPSTPAKLTTCLFSLACGYGVIAFGTLWPDDTGRVSLFWLVLLYLFFAIAALIAAPIGLSAVTRLAAARIVGFLVALWMLGVAVGSYAAAKIARFSSLDPAAMASMHPREILTHYRIFFSYLALIALLLGIIFAALTPAMKKLMHGLR